MKKLLSIFAVVAMVICLTVSVSNAAYNPSISGEDVQIFDEEVPLGELPGYYAAIIVTPEEVSLDVPEDVESEVLKAIKSLAAEVQPGGAVHVSVPNGEIINVVREMDIALIIYAPMCTVMVPNAAFVNILDQAGTNSVEFLLSNGDVGTAAGQLSGFVVPEDIGDDQPVHMEITAGGKKITSFDGNYLTMLLPLTGEDFELGETYNLMQISDNGVVNELEGMWVMDGGEFAMQINVTHLSTFVSLKKGAAPIPAATVDPSSPRVKSPLTGAAVSVMCVLALGVSAAVVLVPRKKI